MATGLPATLAAIPSISSLATLQRRVLNWVVGTSDPDLLTNAQDAINGGINKLNSRNWNKLVKQYAITLTDGGNNYALPTDFRDPSDLERWNSSSYPDGRIRHKPRHTFLRDHDSATETGDPKYYTVQHAELRLYFNIAPSAAFIAKWPQVNLWYHFRHPHMVDPDQKMSYPGDFEEFVVWYAREEISGIRAPEKTGLARVRQQEQWTALIASDTDDTSDEEY